MDFLGGLFLNTSIGPLIIQFLSRIAPFIAYIYITGAIIVLTFIILLNRENLQILNIDFIFILLLLFSGIMIFLQYNDSLMGWLSGAATILLLYTLLAGGLKLSRPNPNALRISLWVIGLFTLCILLLGNRLNISVVSQSMHYFYFDAFPNSVYEEIIYRGILWMFLLNLGLNGKKVLFIQAILFWVSHINYVIFDPLDFWVIVPISGFLFGFMVLRSKSLTPSTLTHILLNLLLGWVQLLN